MCEEIRGAAADVAPNDTGLPKAGADLAAALEAWCKLGSWAVCAACGSLEPRRLKEIDLRRAASTTIPRCSGCRAEGADSVHCVKNTPRPLCGLTKEQILEVDCGVYLRPDHGYGVHTALVRLLWVKESVEARIAALPLRADRAWPSWRRARTPSTASSWPSTATF